MMTDALDRRAAILIAVAGLGILFYGPTGVFSYEGEPATWKVALFVASLAGLVATIVLAVLALARDHPRAMRLPGRETMLLWSAIAFAVALFLVALVSAVTAVDALGESPFEEFGVSP